MPKRQKIYTERIQIEKDISKARKKMAELMEWMETKQASMELLKSGTPVYNQHKDFIEECSRKYERLENTRLRRLQLTLAMFDTIPLGADLSERRVTLQPVDR